jgi:diguanylate cyclase (GGDEF)-like protein
VRSMHTAGTAPSQPGTENRRRIPLLDDVQLHLWDHLHRARIGAITALMIATAVLPQIGSSRFWVTGALLLLVPYSVYLRHYTQRHRRVVPWMFQLDMVFICIIGLLAPATWLASLLIALAVAGISAVALNRRNALVTLALGVVAVSIVLAVHQPDEGIIGVVAYTIAAAGLIITASRVTDEEREARARYGTLVDGLDAVVWEASARSAKPGFVSQRVEVILGHSPTRWTTDDGLWKRSLHGDDRERVIAERRQALRDGVDHDAEYRMAHADGRTLWIREMVRVSADGNRTSGVLFDVTSRKEAELALRERSTHDTLTGLANRVLLAERLQRALVDSTMSAEPVALVVMDLDQFKEVNDTLGHDLGDELLQLVGRRLSASVRDGDTIARLGGDEFALLLTYGAGRAEVDAFLARLHRVLGEPFELAGIPLRVTASMGIVLSPDHGVDPQALMRCADVAMYTAKRTGGGHAFYDPELDRSSTRRLALVSELHHAIENHELVMHYQPKIQVGTNRVVGAEAVVRWEHPKHGMIPPFEFIEIATATGMIQPLTERVLEMSLAECARWAAGGLDLSVAVNLSVLNLYDQRTTDLIKELLIRHRLPAGRLVLEVTESDVMEDPTRAVAQLKELSELGVSIAIDDFGTGYSSLSHLKQLPIHELKIDRSFVFGMATDDSDAMIVRTIIDLSHNLGLDVVAEGVEDEEALNRLAILGCDEAQGFHMGRPLPGPQFDGWMEAWIRRHPVVPTAEADPVR